MPGYWVGGPCKGYLYLSLSLRQEIVRREETKEEPRAKIKDRNPVLRLVVLDFWKSIESW